MRYPEWVRGSPNLSVAYREGYDSGHNDMCDFVSAANERAEKARQGEAESDAEVQRQVAERIKLVSRITELEQERDDVTTQRDQADATVVAQYKVIEKQREQLQVSQQEVKRLREALRVRPAVISMAVLMEQQLSKNDDRTGWQTCTWTFLMRRLREEVSELGYALRHKGLSETVPQESADVANFAMMIADNYQRTATCGECSNKDRPCIESVCPPVPPSRIAALQSSRDTGRPRIVCLCGSSRFMEHFAIMAWKLEKQGAICLGLHYLPPSYTRCVDHIAEVEGVAAQMDELHKRKIDLCDYVLVLNVGGYIGQSTRSEINYAHEHGKPVKYLEVDTFGVPFDGELEDGGCR